MRRDERDAVFAVLREAGLSACSHVVGKPNTSDQFEIFRDAKKVYSAPRSELQRNWSEVSWRIARLRDNPACADSEYERVLDAADPGISPVLTFDPAEDIAAPFIASGARPRVAILREQGVNSQIEMAYSMDRAGFDTYDVHMSDLIAGRAKLSDFTGFVACGGFSYGDVLGAGEGWAKTILFNAQMAEQFAAFFNRRDTFALGVCNGCQMMSNRPRSFRAPVLGPSSRATSPSSTKRASSPWKCSPRRRSSSPAWKAAASPSWWRTARVSPTSRNRATGKVDVALRFVDNRGAVTQTYPLNPNGSPDGITSVTTTDGRFTVLMPHPERVFRAATMSWAPDARKQVADGGSPWMRMFRNARKWVG